jgi:hypothetical protein
MVWTSKDGPKSPSSPAYERIVKEAPMTGMEKLADTLEALPILPDGAVLCGAIDPEFLLYSGERNDIVAALRRPAPRQSEAGDEAEQVCAEAYQVVGSLLSDLGQFDSERGQKILDNLSEGKMIHADVLPWPSFESPTPPAPGLREALVKIRYYCDENLGPSRSSLLNKIAKLADDALTTPSPEPKNDYFEMLWKWFENESRVGVEGMRAEYHEGLSADDFKTMLDEHEAALLAPSPEPKQEAVREALIQARAVLTSDGGLTGPWVTDTIDKLNATIKLVSTPSASAGPQAEAWEPTPAQLNSACLSYDHSFGLMDGAEREMVLFDAREWLRAWQKEGIGCDRNEVVEMCARVVDQANREGPYEAIASAKRIRALKNTAHPQPQQADGRGAALSRPERGSQDVL